MRMVDSNQILTSVAINLLEEGIKNGWNKVKKYFQDLDAKKQIEYQEAYELYIHNTKQKHSQIKTIIYPRKPKDLYSFYESIFLSCNGEIISTENINNLFNEGNKLIVSGTGGIGKSTLFKHLFLNTILGTNYIPILLELRSFNNSSLSLEDEIYHSLCNHGFKLSKEYFTYSMEAGAYVVLLDGYDEINKDNVVRVTAELKSLADRYNGNKYLVSSRPSDGFISWNDFCELEALNLNKIQALNLIRKLDFEGSIKERFYKELDESLYEKYTSFASNPLLLSIMLLTFGKHGSIPNRLNDFYEEAFVTLFNAHDATKDCYTRQIRSQLSCEEFKLIFSYICFKSYFSREFEFSEKQLNDYIQKAKEKLERFDFEIEDFKYDLIQSVCMLIKEGRSYRFTHRTFQEYFAACYTCKLTDELQQKIVLQWIKEDVSWLPLSESYFDMLFNLQSEKVNRIIICPILEEIKELYDKKGFTIDFLENLYSNVDLTEREDKKIVMALEVKDMYLFYGLSLNGRLNDKPKKYRDSIADEIYREVLDYKNTYNHNINPNRIELAFLAEIVSEKKVLKELEWVKNNVEFALKILEKHQNIKNLEDRNIADILKDI